MLNHSITVSFSNQHPVAQTTYEPNIHVVFFIKESYTAAFTFHDNKPIWIQSVFNIK